MSAEVELFSDEEAKARWFAIFNATDAGSKQQIVDAYRLGFAIAAQKAHSSGRSAYIRLTDAADHMDLPYMAQCVAREDEYLEEHRKEGEYDSRIPAPVHYDASADAEGDD